MALVDFSNIFYKASIAETRNVLNATVASAQFAGGQLAPGRWLLQVVPSVDTAFIWVALGAHRDNGGAVTATTVGGARQMPLSTKTITLIEFVVNPGFNDAAPAVVCSSGTATCYLTRVAE